MQEEEGKDRKQQQQQNNKPVLIDPNLTTCYQGSDRQSKAIIIILLINCATCMLLADALRYFEKLGNSVATGLVEVQCDLGAFACKACAHKTELIVKKPARNTYAQFLMLEMLHSFKMGCTLRIFISWHHQCMKMHKLDSSSAPFWSTLVPSKRQLQPLGHKLSPHVTISPGFKRQLPVFSVPSHLLDIKKMHVEKPLYFAAGINENSCQLRTKASCTCMREIKWDKEGLKY